MHHAADHPRSLVRIRVSDDKMSYSHYRQGLNVGLKIWGAKEVREQLWRGYQGTVILLKLCKKGNISCSVHKNTRLYLAGTLRESAKS
jgi:hypothetical protein